VSKPFLCAAGTTLRKQIDTKFPRRDKSSDGWIGDAAHQARPSDHNPDFSAGGVVRAIDIDKDLSKDKKASWELADQIRIAAKTDKRIKYVIHQGQITSARSLWRWRKHSGNPHLAHIHISFNKSGDKDGVKFDIPMLVKVVVKK
jgi:hypothetical protein